MTMTPPSFDWVNYNKNVRLKDEYKKKLLNSMKSNFNDVLKEAQADDDVLIFSSIKQFKLPKNTILSHKEIDFLVKCYSPEGDIPESEIDKLELLREKTNTFKDNRLAALGMLIALSRSKNSNPDKKLAVTTLINEIASGEKTVDDAKNEAQNKVNIHRDKFWNLIYQCLRFLSRKPTRTSKILTFALRSKHEKDKYTPGVPAQK